MGEPRQREERKSDYIVDNSQVKLQLRLKIDEAMWQLARRKGRKERQS